MNLTIVNDQRVEPLTEMFMVSLSAIGEDSRIRVRTPPSTIVITDDDGIYIHARCTSHINTVYTQSCMTCSTYVHSLPRHDAEFPFDV